MEDKIINFLKVKYNAKAIILHGSRARGNPHKNSDWDLLVFTDKVTIDSGGKKFNKQDLDIKVIQLPIENIGQFVDAYPQSCQFTKILLDIDNNIASKIQKAAKKKYSKKKKVSKQEKDYIRKHFDRMLARLEDFKNNPEIFNYHLSTFYIKTIKYWFEYQEKWSQPIKEALKIIEKEDKTFFKALKTITNNTKSNQEKTKAAKTMIKSTLK